MTPMCRYVRRLLKGTTLPLLTLSLLAIGTSAGAATSTWTASWTASPHRTIRLEAAPAASALENQTIRQVVRLGAGGTQLRVRFSNEFGTEPLELGAASIARAGRDGTVDMASLLDLSFGGSPAVVVRPGEPVLSDPAELTVAAGEELSISLYLPAKTESVTMHRSGLQTAYISAPGDFSQSAEMPVAISVPARFSLSGIEVRGGATDAVIVAFGDSITDGAGSTVDANRRWPDLLSNRLRTAGETWEGVVVVNQGMSGNRILRDGTGPSALARFDRDVLSVPGVTHVVVLEGINDIGMIGPQFGVPASDPMDVPTADDIIGGYRQLIARAHSHGLKIVGGTLLPFEGTGGGYYTPDKEKMRETINQWIRTSRAFDGVIDFDVAIRDPQRPKKMLGAYDSGDHLHPGDAGYQAMADAIDLSLFN